jgi:hypothetical protein
MSSQRLSAMSDHAVQGVLDLSRPVAAVLRDLAATWPDAAALEVGLALATACDAIEQMYVGPPPVADRVVQAWRLAALVGGDVLALQSLGRPHATAAHLLDWWDTAEG